MDPRSAPSALGNLAQLYETTIHNRDDGRAFAFVVTPSRSLTGREVPPIDEVASRLRLSRLPWPRPPRRPPFLGRIEPWALPFAIDVALGRDPEAFYGPWGPWIVEEHLRGNRPGGPSAFAQYLAYSPIIPFESSPLGGKALSELAAAGGGIGGALGAYATGDPLLLLAIPAGIVVCGAANGVAEALRIGLRAKLLDLMGVDDPHAQPPDPPPHAH